MGGDMKNYVKKMKNVYYLEYSYPFGAGGAGGAANAPLVGGFDIVFPLGTQNIKANHALISVDKLSISGAQGANQANYPLIFQTSIPCANKFTNLLPDTSAAPVLINQYTSPSLTSYAETLDIIPHLEAGAAGAARFSSYVNQNPDRKVLIPNPMGKQFRGQIMAVDAITGAREVNATITANVILTLRVELLEEEIKD